MSLDLVRANNEIRVAVGEDIHVFRRPGLMTWAAFIDGASSNRTGTAAIALCRATYKGERADVNLLLRAHPQLAMSISGEFAAMLTEEIKIRRG